MGEPIAYYNEIDPYAAAFLRNLIAADLIAPGEVDERSIVDIRPSELAGYTQCHFFAGIGVWSYAARLAGWPDDRPLWTGSCPCQPFSAAGCGGGFDDERHLWPAFHHLIDQCRPVVCLGEQVASKDGLAWLDLVHADMEAADYAFGAVDMGAASVGAPHIRQRLWWCGMRDVANAEHSERRALLSGRGGDDRQEGRWDEGAKNVGKCNSPRLLADDLGAGLEGLDPGEMGHERATAERGGGPGGVEYLPSDGRLERWTEPSGRSVVGGRSIDVVVDDQRTGPTNGFWRDADWLRCRDGKWRPVEPGTFPLAHGTTARVGKLRAAGNAIVAPLAAEFIGSVMESFPHPTERRAG